MKKFIYIAGAIAFSFMVGCNKKENGNKTVLPAETTAPTDTETHEVTKRYVAEDGSSAHVTFRDNKKDKSISIRSNNKTITAPWKSDSVYSNYDFVIITRNDSVIITQGENIIQLKKARGQ